MPTKPEQASPGFARGGAAVVRIAAGGAGAYYGAAEAVDVFCLLLARVAGQVARRVEGSEREGDLVKSFKARVRSCKPVRAAISVSNKAMPCKGPAPSATASGP